MTQVTPDTGLPRIGPAPADLPCYEQRLSANKGWALTEGSLFFEGGGAVQETLRRITTQLGQLRIPYAVVGGMALFQHGVRRFTEDVDILVTRNALRQIHEQLSGRGYLPPFATSKNLRDVHTGVKIEFLISGDFPGDGKIKPVPFPDPEPVSFDSAGVQYINLEKLVELKLASGMTGAGRQKDLGDVVALIKTLRLPAEFTNKLNPYVQSTYRDLWVQAQTRYMKWWRPIALANKARSPDEMAAARAASLAELRQMQAAGIVIDAAGAGPDGAIQLVSTDPEIARRFDMHEESEYLSRDDAPPPKGAE